MSGLAKLTDERRLGVVTRLLDTPSTIECLASPTILSSRTIDW